MIAGGGKDGAAPRDVAAGEPRLSVVVVARDEEARIARCLEAVAFADEILVADTGSRDRTREIAAALGARVVELRWRGFGPTKREALGLARGVWILSLDADEVVDARLAGAIRTVIAAPLDDAAATGAPRRPALAGFELRRRGLFLGRWLSHGGWYPDWVLRLVRRGSFTMSDDLVHESLAVDGRVGRLDGDLLHHTDPDLDGYLRKMLDYADLGARMLYARGERFRLTQLLVRPPATFIKRYVLKRGCLDGLPGLLLALLSAVHVLVKYARLWELTRDAGGALATDDGQSATATGTGSTMATGTGSTTATGTGSTTATGTGSTTATGTRTPGEAERR